MGQYPEHEKVAAVTGDAQVIGTFLEWLGGEDMYHICKWDEVCEEFWPIYDGIERLLADYFDIDLITIDAEKRAMLEEIVRQRDAEQ